MFASSTPQRSNDHVVVVERVVQMAGQLPEIKAPQVRNVSVGVGSASAWKQRQNLYGVLEFSSEQILMVAVADPPCSFALDVAGGGLGEPDAPPRQRDRSPLSTSAASTSRPATTSACD